MASQATPIILATIGVVAAAFASREAARRSAISGKECDPTGYVPPGWACDQREIDGAWILKPVRIGETCDPLDLPIPGYVCVPAGDAFVLLPEAQP